MDACGRACHAHSIFCYKGGSVGCGKGFFKVGLKTVAAFTEGSLASLSSKNTVEEKYTYYIPVCHCPPKLQQAYPLPLQAADFLRMTEKTVTHISEQGVGLLGSHNR